MQKRFYPLPELSDAATVLQSASDTVIRRTTVELYVGHFGRIG
jgi:hypothetical protein